MSRSTGLSLLAGSLLVLSAVPALAAGQVGEPAADFTLEDTWGNWHSSQDYRHNTVVLLNMIGYS